MPTPLPPTAVMIVQGDAKWRAGRHYPALPLPSMRKSFLSALMGPYVEDGTIDLSLTLDALRHRRRRRAEPEREAGDIYDLLTARSGIYHRAGYETPLDASIKPTPAFAVARNLVVLQQRELQRVGTIFHQLTRHGIHETFRDLIARPLGMEDFRLYEERKDGWMVRKHATAPGLSVSDVGARPRPVSA